MNRAIIANENDLVNVANAIREVSGTSETLSLTEMVIEITNVGTNMNAHMSNTSNPHNVTKTQVGLENVDNVKQYSELNPPPNPTPKSIAAATITDGTFAGYVAANTQYQAPASMLLRNSKLVTTETSPSNNGEICWIYE